MSTTYLKINTKDANKLYSEAGSVLKVFNYLTSKCHNNKNLCYPGQETIASACKICVKTVQRAVKRLCQLGLVKKKRRQQNSNIYILLNKPTDKDIQENLQTKEIKENIENKCNKYKKESNKFKFNKNTSPNKNTFNNFSQRQYNYNSLEDELLKRDCPWLFEEE